MEDRKDSNQTSTEDFINEADHFLEDHNTCCLCGTQLVFQHKIDYVTLTVREDADCPSCRIRLKTKDHGLH